MILFSFKKVELEDEEFEFDTEEEEEDETSGDMPGLVRGEVPTLSVEHLRQLSRPPKGFSTLQQQLLDCTKRHDRSDIFMITGV